MGKCSSEHWVTPVLNLTQSRVSPAERGRRRRKEREGRGMEEGNRKGGKKGEYQRRKSRDLLGSRGKRRVKERREEGEQGRAGGTRCAGIP